MHVEIPVGISGHLDELSSHQLLMIEDEAAGKRST